MFCIKCGYKNIDDAEFCVNCGISLKGTDDTPLRKSSMSAKTAKRKFFIPLLIFGVLIIGSVLAFLLIFNKGVSATGNWYNSYFREVLAFKENGTVKVGTAYGSYEAEYIYDATENKGAVLVEDKSFSFIVGKDSLVVKKSDGDIVFVRLPDNMDESEVFELALNPVNIGSDNPESPTQNSEPVNSSEAIASPSTNESTPTITIIPSVTATITTSPSPNPQFNPDIVSPNEDSNLVGGDQLGDVFGVISPLYEVIGGWFNDKFGRLMFNNDYTGYRIIFLDNYNNEYPFEYTYDHYSNTGTITYMKNTYTFTIVGETHLELVDPKGNIYYSKD